MAFRGTVIAAVTLVGIALASMLMTGKLQSLLGATGMHVISRGMSVLMAALAVQFIFDGIRQSGLLASGRAPEQG